MRAWKSCSPSQASAAWTRTSSGASANPGTPAGKASETEMPRDTSIWRTNFPRPSSRPSFRPSSRKERRKWWSSGPVPSRAPSARPHLRKPRVRPTRRLGPRSALRGSHAPASREARCSPAIPGIGPPPAHESSTPAHDLARGSATSVPAPPPTPPENPTTRTSPTSSAARPSYGRPPAPRPEDRASRPRSPRSRAAGRAPDTRTRTGQPGGSGGARRARRAIPGPWSRRIRWVRRARRR